MNDPRPSQGANATRGELGGRDMRISGILFTFVGVDFLLVVTGLEALYPGYSVHHNTISDLLAVGTSTSYVGEPMLFLAAFAWILGGYFLYRRSGQSGLRLLNVLPGVGLLLAVLSPENVNIVVHSVGAVLAFFPGPIAAIVSYRSIRTEFRYFALAMGLLSLGCTAVYFGAYTTSLVQLGLGPGGWERVIVYPLLVWLIGFGSYLMAQSAQQRAVTPSTGAIQAPAM